MYLLDIMNLYRENRDVTQDQLLKLIQILKNPDNVNVKAIERIFNRSRN